MKAKVAYLIVSLLDNEKQECGLCITTDQTKAQAIGNRIFTSSTSIKTIATLELSEHKFAQIYSQLLSHDIDHLIEKGWIAIPTKHYSLAFKMLELA